MKRFLNSWLPAVSLFSGLLTIDQVVALSNSENLTTVDVVVVGGGFSGLMSAFDLHDAGLNTVVLEAKSKIGGKSRSVKLQSGPGIVELGATWINNKTQPEVFNLTQHFGLTTIPQYTDGAAVFQGPDGAVNAAPDGGSTALTPLAFLAILNKSIEEIDIRTFDNFSEKRDVSFAEWIAQMGLWNDTLVRGLAGALTSSIVGREPDEIGAHYFLDYVKSGYGLESLISEGGYTAQSLMIAEGTTAIATNLANAIGTDNVHTSTPAIKITQDNDTITVTTATNQVYVARKVVLAVTQNTYANIEFLPPLPCDKNLVVARTRPGNYAKVILTYSEPWWRTSGLAGKITSLVGPIRFSWEISNPALSQYSLAIFVSGDTATCWFALPEEQQQNAIIEHLAELVGTELSSKARDVLEVNYAEWSKEEYIGGGPTTTLGPGLLRKYGASMREPVGHLHFAGTELAYEWKGYLEGAITSGQRAAREIIQSF